MTSPPMAPPHCRLAGLLLPCLLSWTVAEPLLVRVPCAPSGMGGHGGAWGHITTLCPLCAGGQALRTQHRACVCRAGETTRGLRPGSETLPMVPNLTPTITIMLELALTLTLTVTVTLSLS